MDILDASDEELAPLQASVDEMKGDLSGHGDMEGDVEQVSETPSAFPRSLSSCMKQIHEVHFDKYDSKWANRMEGFHRGITRAESLHGSCTDVFTNLETQRRIFMEEDFECLREWGIESRHGSYAFIRV